MLILTRRVGETVMIGDEVTVTVLGVKGNQVRVGINAPKNVAVHREEIFERIKRGIGPRQMWRVADVYQTHAAPWVVFACGAQSMCASIGKGQFLPMTAATALLSIHRHPFVVEQIAAKFHFRIAHRIAGWHSRPRKPATRTSACAFRDKPRRQPTGTAFRKGPVRHRSSGTGRSAQSPPSVSGLRH